MVSLERQDDRTFLLRFGIENWTEDDGDYLVQEYKATIQARDLKNINMDQLEQVEDNKWEVQEGVLRHGWDTVKLTPPFKVDIKAVETDDFSTFKYKLNGRTFDKDFKSRTIARATALNPLDILMTKSPLQ